MREQRHPPLERAPGERDLEVIALAVGGFGGVGGRLAVDVGIDVGPADQHQTVDRVEQPLGRARVHGQQHGERAGCLHRGHVGVGDQVGGLVPEGPAGPLPDGTDPDERLGLQGVLIPGARADPSLTLRSQRW